MRSKKLSAEGSLPVTVRVSIEDVRRIDEWRRSFPNIPSRGDFLRQAIEEKLSRDEAALPCLEMTGKRRVEAMTIPSPVLQSMRDLDS